MTQQTREHDRQEPGTRNKTQTVTAALLKDTFFFLNLTDPRLSDFQLNSD